MIHQGTLAWPSGSCIPCARVRGALPFPDTIMARIFDKNGDPVRQHFRTGTSSHGSAHEITLQATDDKRMFCGAPHTHRARVIMRTITSWKR